MSWCDPRCPGIFACVRVLGGERRLSVWAVGRVRACVRVVVVVVAGISVCTYSEVCASQLSCCGLLQSFVRAGAPFHSQRSSNGGNPCALEISTPETETLDLKFQTPSPKL